MNQKKTSQTLLLITQIIITLLYGAMIVHMILILYEEDPNTFFQHIISYLPQFVILISSIIPQIVIRLKRKLHSQDGEIYPLLFTMLALQATLLIPKYTELSGLYLLDPHFLVIIERISILGTAALFLLSSLRYYGFNSSRIDRYTFLTLGICALVCTMAPVSSIDSGDYTNILNSEYDAIIVIASMLLYGATVLTYLVYAIKDKSSINAKRLLGFSCLIIGINLALAYSFVPVITSCVLYILGIIILTLNIRESF